MWGSNVRSSILGRYATGLLIAVALLLGAIGTMNERSTLVVSKFMYFKNLMLGAPAAFVGRSGVFADHPGPAAAANSAPPVYASATGNRIDWSVRTLMRQGEAVFHAYYRRFPAIVTGLTGLILLPVLALPGLLLRMMHRRRRLSAPVQNSASRLTDTDRLEQYGRLEQRGPVWVKVEGAQDCRARLDGEMLRIGREADNDICLEASSVHRYHALVHRTCDRDVVITDLSGEEGNGMLVNGTRLQCVALHDGDRIQLGQVRLRFELGQI